MHIQSFYYYSDLTKKMDEIYYPFEILPDRIPVVHVTILTIYIRINKGLVTMRRSDVLVLLQRMCSSRACR